MVDAATVDSARLKHDLTPGPHGRSSEDSVFASGDEMALSVEGVVESQRVLEDDPDRGDDSAVF
jgi:hypothetical protein